MYGNSAFTRQSPPPLHLRVDVPSFLACALSGSDVTPSKKSAVNPLPLFLFCTPTFAVTVFFVTGSDPARVDFYPRYLVFWVCDLVRSLACALTQQEEALRKLPSCRKNSTSSWPIIFSFINCVDFERWVLIKPKIYRGHNDSQSVVNCGLYPWLPTVHAVSARLALVRE